MSGRAFAKRACSFCGIQPGNRAGISVYSYTLLRSIAQPAGIQPRTRTRSFGQLSICDRCLAERHRGASMTTAGFRTEART